MSDKLSLVDLEMQKWIDRLDDVAKSYEAVWGFDRLPRLVAPELAAKWESQVAKINVAIETSNLKDIQELGHGMIRAWSILDKDARTLGHVPNDIDVWSASHPDSGRRYKITKNVSDARGVVEEGVVVYTLEEVVRILETKQLVNVVKDQFPGAVVKNVSGEFDFKEGDKVTI